MGFFGTFWTWLNGQLATYIGDNTARLAIVLEPAVVTLATIYVMVWGYLHLTGKIDEPLTAGLKRIATVGLVLGCALRLWLYNTLIVDTFYAAPSQLAAAVIGATDPVATIDAIWERGGAVAGSLWTKGAGFLDVGCWIAAALVWLLIGLLCVYSMFLIALSSVALAVLLALGPMFIVALFFDASRRLFSAWIAQLANYGLITLLTVMIAALLLQVVQSYAAQTAALGAGINMVDALHMELIAVLVFLIMRQVMPIASGLAGGLSLNTFGFLSRGLWMGWAPAVRAAMPATRYSAPLVARTLLRTAEAMGAAASGAARRASPDGAGPASGPDSLGRRWREERQ